MVTASSRPLCLDSSFGPMGIIVSQDANKGLCLQFVRFFFDDHHIDLSKEVRPVDGSPCWPGPEAVVGPDGSLSWPFSLLSACCSLGQRPIGKCWNHRPLIANGSIPVTSTVTAG